MIRLDPSPSKTVVIVCDECPHWSAIRFGMNEAHEAAIHHEKMYHPGILKARQRAWIWRKRNGVTRR